MADSLEERSTDNTPAPNDVPRYDVHGSETEAMFGRWIEYADYAARVAALEAERDALEAENQTMRDKFADLGVSRESVFGTPQDSEPTTK